MNKKTIELLPYKDFTCTIEYSSEDGVYYGKLNTNDLILFESEYATLIKTEFHKAVDDYIQLLEDYDPRDNFNIGDLQ